MGIPITLLSQSVSLSTSCHALYVIRDASMDSLQPDEKRVKFSNLEQGGQSDAENQQLEAAHDGITPDLHDAGT